MEPKFEEKGLIPAILQDFQTNQVLMLGYMNREAWEKTLKEKKVFFFSRSKKKLWLKGETSGNYQSVRAVYLDCDRDSILIKVKTEGATCHTGKYSCFFNTISNSLRSKTSKASENFLEDLFHIIEERKKNPKKNSYTCHLLAQGKEKISQKLGEEAIELIIASLKNNKEEMIYEIADLIYHLLVLINFSRIDLKDIAEELSNRMK